MPVVTRFTVFRDMVRGMSQHDRTMLALACIKESGTLAKGTPAEFEWNKATLAVNRADAAERPGAQDGERRR